MGIGITSLHGDIYPLSVPFSFSSLPSSVPVCCNPCLWSIACIVHYFCDWLIYWKGIICSFSLPILRKKLVLFVMQAVVFYELAFHFNPLCAEACNNLGVIYKDRENLDKAVECYQAILDSNLFLLKRLLTEMSFLLFSPKCIHESDCDNCF